MRGVVLGASQVWWALGKGMGAGLAGAETEALLGSEKCGKFLQFKGSEGGLVVVSSKLLWMLLQTQAAQV